MGSKPRACYGDHPDICRPTIARHYRRVRLFSCQTLHRSRRPTPSETSAVSLVHPAYAGLRLTGAGDLVHIDQACTLIWQYASLGAPRSEWTFVDRDPHDVEAGCRKLLLDPLRMFQPFIEGLRHFVRVAEQHQQSWILAAFVPCQRHRNSSGHGLAGQLTAPVSVRAPHARHNPMLDVHSPASPSHRLDVQGSDTPVPLQSMTEDKAVCGTAAAVKSQFFKQAQFRCALHIRFRFALLIR